MIKTFLAISFLAMVAAWGLRGSRQLPLQVGFKGETYVFPRDHINAANIPPEGRLYVRLAPPASDFHLVLDEWSDLPSDHGPNVPRISRLSDSFGKFSGTETGAGRVVCDLGPQPHFNCGFLLEDGPVKWAVLFDKALFSQSGEIRKRALRTVASYKVARST